MYFKFKLLKKIVGYSEGMGDKRLEKVYLKGVNMREYIQWMVAGGCIQGMSFFFK